MDKNKLTKALKQYSEGKISMEKAAELADAPIWKFLDVLKERKIPIRYDLDDIKKEIWEITRNKNGTDMGIFDNIVADFKCP